MDIAAMSMNMSVAKVQLSAGISVAKKVMDQQEVQAAGLIDMMEGAAAQLPPSDHIIDVKA